MLSAVRLVCETGFIQMPVYAIPMAKLKKHEESGGLQSQSTRPPRTLNWAEMGDGTWELGSGQKSIPLNNQFSVAHFLCELPLSRMLPILTDYKAAEEAARGQFLVSHQPGAKDRTLINSLCAGDAIEPR